MNKKSLLTTLFSALLLANFLCVKAQDYYAVSSDSYVRSEAYTSQPSGEKHNAFKTTWQKNRFKDTWFITFGSGAQVLMAEDDDKGSFGSRVTYAPSITIGKYFSPIWGLRVNFTGGSLHGFNDGNSGTYRKWNKGSSNYLGEGYAGQPGYPAQTGTGFLTWDPRWESLGYNLDNGQIIPNGADGTYRWRGGDNGELYMQHVRYVAANFNFMFDLITLFGDYNPKRLFDVTPFIGVTYAHLFPHHGQGAYDTFGANGGLNFKFRINDKFNFNLEGAVNLYPDEFDGHMGGSRSMDVVAQATAGITYKIGKSTWDVVEPMNYKLIEDLNKKINDLKSQLDAIQPCEDCPECPTPTEEKDPDPEIVFLPDPVFFRLDKADIDAGEWSKIDKAAKYLNDYPNARVVVTGYADRQTGTPDYNMRLSERRAKAVSNVLVSKHHISQNRISINWEGDRIQPFEVNDWNRVVVFVIE